MSAANADRGGRRNETQMALEGDREVVITRIIDGSQRAVFDAWTKPEFLMRWWAPKSHGVVMARCDAELREGGTYRYVMSRGGQEMPFSGRYIAFEPHARLVYTQVFEPMRQLGEIVTEAIFEDLDGRTRITLRETYPSTDVRATVLAQGTEKGMRESMEQFEALVAELG